MHDPLVHAHQRAEGKEKNGIREAKEGKEAMASGPVGAETADAPIEEPEEGRDEEGDRARAE
jgi:hypothetical protein